MIRRVGAALAAGVLAGALPATAFAHAKRLDASIHAQQARVHAVHERLHQKRAQLHDAQAKVGSIAAQLQTTNRNIAAVNGRLAGVQAQIRSTQRKLAWNRLQLAAAQTTLRRHQDALNRRLVDAYEEGGLGYVDVLLRARSFGDFVERWNDVRYVVKSNEATIRSRESDEARVAGIETALAGTQAQLQSQAADADRQRDALGALATQRAQLLAVADAQRRHVQAEVEELDEESAAYESYLEHLIRSAQAEDEAERQADIRARRLAGEAIPESEEHHGATTLQWPVSGPITSPFGMRTNPITHQFILHAGIDIAVPTGTTVAAAAAGKVIVAGWDDGGCGNMVVIDHGDHLATQYCHLSQIFVGVGQQVQRGQAIAASGSTGNSTGPHVHFGVRVDGKPVDPMSYLR